MKKSYISEDNGHAILYDTETMENLAGMDYDATTEDDSDEVDTVRSLNEIAKNMGYTVTHVSLPESWGNQPIENFL